MNCHEQRARKRQCLSEAGPITTMPCEIIRLILERLDPASLRKCVASNKALFYLAHRGMRAQYGVTRVRSIEELEALPIVPHPVLGEPGVVSRELLLVNEASLVFLRHPRFHEACEFFDSVTIQTFHHVTETNSRNAKLCLARVFMKCNNPPRFFLSPLQGVHWRRWEWIEQNELTAPWNPVRDFYASVIYREISSLVAETLWDMFLRRISTQQEFLIKTLTLKLNVTPGDSLLQSRRGFDMHRLVASLSAPECKCRRVIVCFDSSTTTDTSEVKGLLDTFGAEAETLVDAIAATGCIERAKAFPVVSFKPGAVDEGFWRQRGNVPQDILVVWCTAVADTDSSLFMREDLQEHCMHTLAKRIV